MIRLTQEKVNLFITSRGYIWLSGEYINEQSNLHIKCISCDNETTIRISVFRSRNKCQVCKNITFNNNIEQTITSHNSKLLDITGTRTHSKIHIVCENGHHIYKPYKHLGTATWCKYCKFDKLIKRAYQMANSRGGSCLSTKCTSVANKLKWQCEFGHTWIAEYNTIRRGSWCSQCVDRLGEKITRLYMEAIFGRPFPKCRPKWLTNTNGHKLELDGFCEELGIAFEHNGFQHYKQISYFKYDNDGFRSIQQRDKIKHNKCKEQNIKVIIVPEMFTLTKLKNLKSIIKSQCVTLGIDLPHNFDDINVDIKAAYRNKIDEARSLANNHGGKCLSDKFIEHHNDKDRLLFECKCGYKWEASLARIRFGTWCRKCSNYTRKISAD